MRLLLCGSGKLSWKAVLTNINIFSILFDTLLFVYQVKLPCTVDDTLATVNDMTDPIATLVAGMLVASLPLREIVLSRRIYLTAFLRLVLIPLVLLLFVRISDIVHPDGHSDTVVLINFFTAVNPAASTIAQMAMIYGQNTRKASAIYGITILFCVITVPLTIDFYRLAI